ncbi:t-snare domain-containing protein [Anaeramoeba flamelloides]|uniref:T-snare domain-containing protein n=1 Tax=Anaeramoeba flamelloides TaxID=1746091 RepID=A0ABQ8YVE5_9EUKA|nr:t-snare domain-containing protein [Anaeramoeba flamelloides]
MSFQEQLDGSSGFTKKKEKSKPKDKFSILNEKIVGNIHLIAQNINQLTQLVNVIGRNNDTEMHRKNISNLTNSINNSIKRTKQDWKVLKQNTSKENKMKVSKLENFFEELQTNYKQISKLSDKKQREFIPHKESNTFSDEDENQSLLDNDRLEEEKMNRKLQNQINYTNAIINEREEGILDIEAAVNDVNEMMRDIASMIQTQGKNIETIADNVETSRERVIDANDNLRGANKYQKKSRNKMCCILLIVAIIILVVVLSIVFSLHKF